MTVRPLSITNKTPCDDYGFGGFKYRLEGELSSGADFGAEIYIGARELTSRGEEATRCRVMSEAYNYMAEEEARVYKRDQLLAKTANSNVNGVSVQ